MLSSPEEIRGWLVPATVDTFGDLGFLLADEIEEQAQPSDASETDPSPCATASIHLLEDATLVVEVSDGVLETMAINMLALDDRPDRQTQHDALGELINVLAGRVVGELEAGGHAVALGLPVITAGPAPLASAATSVLLRFPEGVATVSVLQEGGVTA